MTTNATRNFRRIAIVGSESTGKSELSEALAEHYNTVWVPEYAREYLEKINRAYVFEDLKIIADGQMHLEDAYEKKTNNILFCDTNLTVIKIWSEFKFGKIDDWIINEIKKRKYDLHLLGVKYPLLTFQVQSDMVVRCIFRIKNSGPVGENDGIVLIDCDRSNSRVGPDDVRAYELIVEYLGEFLK